MLAVPDPRRRRCHLYRDNSPKPAPRPHPQRHDGGDGSPPMQQPPPCGVAGKGAAASEI